MKKLLAVITLPLLVSACQSNGDDKATITATDLQHHNWNLVKIDDIELNPKGNKPAANLELGENLSANGNSGCNNFFGQAELKDNQIRIQNMGMTQKMCMENQMKVEMTMGSVLREWSDITLTKNTLQLKNDQHTLTFKLADWK